MSASSTTCSRRPITAPRTMDSLERSSAASSLNSHEAHTIDTAFGLLCNLAVVLLLCVVILMAAVSNMPSPLCPRRASTIAM